MSLVTCNRCDHLPHQSLYFLMRLKHFPLISLYLKFPFLRP
ncbi:hypothetical protein SLEP1_g30715 [Rubroshorea leprosula]|uniref:Uncharacterized protein n=1 Tax=Rubroshorea leprosula TaxID=152421 RepID=A0AAV5K6I6_9ROSI|nr:hypothetical protein SLEP1_g30715 [Rubroshorea leprosula]